MEKKQTAVEWLVEQIKSDQNQKALSASEWMEVIERAKEIEKEQIIECFLEADADAYRKEPKYKTPQDYIRQTYEH